MKKNTYIKDLEFFGTQYDGNTILQSKLKKIAKHPSSVMALAIRFEEFNKETASFLLISSPLSHNFLKISALSIISPSLSEFYCI